MDIDTPGTIAAFSTTNRLASAWADYDSAGNLTHFKFPGQPALDWTVAYDGENKQWRNRDQEAVKSSKNHRFMHDLNW